MISIWSCCADIEIILEFQVA